MAYGELRSVDVCTSALNEEAVIGTFIQTTLETFDQLSNLECRLIVVDNGSQDRTWESIQAAANADPRITAIKLTRNFGFDCAILSALSLSSADASIVMASDLQDDPKDIPAFVDLYERGYEHVYQVVAERPSISVFRRLLTTLFYRVGNSLTSGSITPNATDFRMISRRLRHALLKTPDRARLNRAILNFFALKSSPIELPRSLRTTGKSKTSFRYALSLGLRGIFSNSKRLLDYVSLFSVWMVLLTFVALMVAVTLFFLIGVPFGGFGTIVGLLLLLFAMNFLSLGVIAQYLGIVTEIIQDRPLFVVDETINENPIK